MEGDANLPTPISDLIGTTHMFEIKSHTYYEYGTFESFTCWSVNPSQPPEETTGSSTVDNESVAAGKLPEQCSQSPTVVTPAKPAEDKRRKR